MRFFNASGRAGRYPGWLPATTSWNAWISTSKPLRTLQCAPRGERTRVTDRGIHPHWMVQRDDQPPADCNRSRGRSRLWRGKALKDLICPYPRKYRMVGQGNVEVRTGAGHDGSNFSFVLSATDDAQKSSFLEKGGVSKVEGASFLSWEDLGIQPADERCAGSMGPEVPWKPKAAEVGVDNGDPADPPQIRYSSPLKDTEAIFEETLCGERKSLPKHRRLTSADRDQGATCVWPPGDVKRDDTFLASSHPPAKRKRRTYRRQLASHPSPFKQAAGVVCSTGAALKNCTDSAKIREMLHVMHADYAQWAAVLEKGSPVDALVLYNLLTKCSATATRLRGLLYLLNRTVLERLHLFHINDIAKLTRCMQQVGHLRTDFLLAASPVIVSNATRASASSCCLLLESYAALRFFVAGSVGALCRALAHPKKVSSMTLSQVASAFGSLARLDIRPKYLLAALSKQFLNCWQLLPGFQALGKETGAEFLPASRVSSRAVGCTKIRCDSNASILIRRSSCDNTLNCADSQLPTAAASSTDTSTQVPFQAAPNDVTLLLYAVGKLQWRDPRLIQWLLQVGIPVCASEMHSHQLAIAAVALARLFEPPTSTSILRSPSVNSFEKAPPAAHASNVVRDVSTHVQTVQPAGCSPVFAAADMTKLFKREATTAFQRIVCEAAERLPQFKAEIFCMFLGACATVSLRWDTLISRLAVHLPRLILTFRLEDVVLLMVALSKLNANSAAIIDIVISHVRGHVREYNFAAAQTLLETCCSYGVIRTDWLHLSSGFFRQSEVPPTSLSRLFCAMCNCGYNSPELFLPLFAAVEAAVLLLTVDELADICASAAFLGLLAHPILRSHVTNTDRVLRSLIGRDTNCQATKKGKSRGNCNPYRAPLGLLRPSARPCKPGKETAVGEDAVDNGLPMQYNSAVNLALASLICPPSECRTWKRLSKRRRLARATEIVSLTGGILEAVERRAEATGSFCICCGVLTPSQLRRLALLCGAMVLVSRGLITSQTKLCFTVRLRRLLAQQVQRMLARVRRLPCQPSAVPLPLTPSPRDPGSNSLLVYRSKNISNRVSSDLACKELGRPAPADVRNGQQYVPDSAAQSVARFHDYCSASISLRPRASASVGQQYRETLEAVHNAKASPDLHAEFIGDTSAYRKEQLDCVTRHDLAFHGLVMDFEGSVPEQKMKPKTFIEQSCMTGLVAIQTVLEEYFQVRGRLHVDGNLTVDATSGMDSTSPVGGDSHNASRTASLEAPVDKHCAFTDSVEYSCIDTFNPYSYFLILDPWEVLQVKRSISTGGGAPTSGSSLRVRRTCRAAETSPLGNFRQTRRHPTLERSLLHPSLRSQPPRCVVQVADGRVMKRGEAVNCSIGVAIIWGDAGHFWHGCEQRQYEKLFSDSCMDCGSAVSKHTRSPNSASRSYSYATTFQLCCFSHLRLPSQQSPRSANRGTPGKAAAGTYSLRPLLIPHSIWNALPTDALRAEYLTKSLAQVTS